MTKKSVFSQAAAKPLALTAAALCLSIASTAWAGDDARPCRSDAIKLCKGVEGLDNITNCLVQNKSELSPACRKSVSTAKEKVETLTLACLKDKVKFCKEVEFGEYRVLNCLKQHADKLSPGCKAELGD